MSGNTPTRISRDPSVYRKQYPFAGNSFLPPKGTPRAYAKHCDIFYATRSAIPQQVYLTQSQTPMPRVTKTQRREDHVQLEAPD